MSPNPFGNAGAPPLPPASPEERGLGALLRTGIWLLREGQAAGNGAPAPQTEDELELAIERLCTEALTNYRVLLEEARRKVTQVVELEAGPRRLTLRVSEPGHAFKIEVPGDKAAEAARVILSEALPRF